jgi:hypothetical protein
VKDFTVFWTRFYQHLNTNEYKLSLAALCKCDTMTNVTDAQAHVCTSLALEIFSVLLNLMSQNVAETETKATQRPPMSADGRGKVRYVGGMVIAKLRYHYMGIVKRSLFRPEMFDKHHNARDTVELLTSLESQSNVSVDPDSLNETNRRQNLRQSLLNISDGAMDYFMALTEEIDRFLNVSSLNIHKENLFKALQDHIGTNERIIAKWKELFADNSKTEDIFMQVNSRYIRVCANQFKKDLKDSFQLEKAQAHRKQLKEKTEKAKAKITLIDMKYIKSEKPELVHLKLKIMAKENPDVFSSRQFTKKDLICMSQAYAVGYKTTSKKEELAEGLCKALCEQDMMPNPDMFKQDPGESTSFSLDGPVEASSPSKAKAVTKTKRKGKGKGIGKKSCKILCKVCKGEYSNCSGIDWIQCDLCDCWLHRHCGNISDDMWEIISKGDDDWYCPICVNEDC